MNKIICKACFKQVASIDASIIYHGKIVHVVCPGIDYLTHPINPYHAHIFWNEVVPGGYYNYNPDISKAEVERQAYEYNLTIHFEEENGKIYIMVDC